MESLIFQLTITNENGFTFKKNISETICNEIVILATRGIISNEKEPQVTDHPIISQPKSDGLKEMALNEYCQSLNPKNNKERIAVIAIYLEKFEKSHLLRKDVPQYFKQAGFSVLKNPTRDLQDTVAKGWISASPGSNEEFFPTAKGKKVFLENDTK